MKRGTYQGETLNFETPAAFFPPLTSNRWTMLAELQGAGKGIGVRELARRLSRDVSACMTMPLPWSNWGLIERSETGALSCPYADIHVDMHVSRLAA